MLSYVMWHPVSTLSMVLLSTIFTVGQMEVGLNCCSQTGKTQRAPY